MDKFDILCSTLLELQKYKDKHDPLYLDALAIKMTEDLTSITGNFLHGLFQAKPQEETVRMMIDAVPSGLFLLNEKGQIPLQTAVWHNDSVRYIPVLAKGGIRQKMNQRGGLLLEDPYTESMIQPKSLIPEGPVSKCSSRSRSTESENVLQLIAHLQNTTKPVLNDEHCLKAIVELRNSNLILKEDIERYNLLFWSCGPMSKLRFKYFVHWYPNGLKDHRLKGLPIIHALLTNSSRSRFALFLEHSVKLYPNELGLLFQRNAKGETAIEVAVEVFGREATFKIIEECLTRDSDIPILHYVFQNTPQFLNDFTMRYASAAHLLDSRGRSLSQVQLASGYKTFGSDATFFVKLTDEEVNGIDPGTGLYPFMLLASEQTSDMSAIYYLLRRCPSLVVPCTNGNMGEGLKKRKASKIETISMR